MPKVIVPQKNMSLEVEVGSNLMNALLAAGLPVASSCHGDGVCSMCRVRVSGALPAPVTHELDSLHRNKCEPDERLSCQVVVNSDLTVRTKYW